MYRIFAMGYSGTVFQLSAVGWVRKNGTSFPTLGEVREFLRKHAAFPPLPSGEVIADSYIGKVDTIGDLIESYSHLVETKG